LEARLLAAAVEATRAATEHARANRSRRHEVAQSFAHDVKLSLDTECQIIAIERIQAHFPDHAILAEESAGNGPISPPQGFEWIIDPIDGTVNFSHGMPYWCCSVAVRLDGRTLAGAVHAADFNELYTATRSGPALCNGVPLQVSAVGTLAQSMVMTGLDQKVNPNGERFGVFHAIAQAVQKTRVMGAAALDICRVAAGQAEGYFESSIFTWDIAAAALVVERAGGRTETLAALGPHRWCFMATNGPVHEPLKELIAAALGPAAC
jgi:myo-inositol-1(or 4)-monophosphatase